MITLLRRFLVLAVLLFWQGGFLFYSAVVVPIGQEMLTSGTSQGFITRQVTIYLNLAGAAALLPLLCDALIRNDASRLRRWVRLLAWAGMAVTLGMLAWLHPRLDTFLDSEMQIVQDMRGFRPWHRWYLWTCTVQWALGLVYIFLMLWAWRDEDRALEAAKQGESR